MASDPNTTAATGNTRPFPTAITNAQLTRPNMSPVPYPHPHVHPHHHQNLYTGPQPTRPTPNHPQHPSSLSQGVLYPVASSGRGFIPKPSPLTHAVTVAANPGSVNPTAAVAGYPPRPIVPYPHGLSHPVHAMRPPHNQHHHLHPAHLGSPGLGPVPATVKGIPVSSPHSKGVSPSLVADSNGYRDTRDRGRDDTLVTVRDRKVRITDGASLYALCRSWLRNGFPEETEVGIRKETRIIEESAKNALKKPQYGDSVKSLPKPLPLAVPATHLPKKEAEEEEETEDKENEESVEHLSPRSLLKRHVKHARKVRARLREERLRRIARYKTRLALLLPPLVEQFRSDTAPRN